MRRKSPGVLLDIFLIGFLALLAGCQDTDFFGTGKKKQNKQTVSPEERESAGSRPPDFGGLGDQGGTGRPTFNDDPGPQETDPGAEAFPGMNQSGQNSGAGQSAGQGSGGAVAAGSAETGGNFLGGNFGSPNEEVPGGIVSGSGAGLVVGAGGGSVSQNTTDPNQSGVNASGDNFGSGNFGAPNEGFPPPGGSSDGSIVGSGSGSGSVIGLPPTQGSLVGSGSGSSSGGLNVGGADTTGGNQGTVQTPPGNPSEGFPSPPPDSGQTISGGGSGSGPTILGNPNEGFPGGGTGGAGGGLHGGKGGGTIGQEDGGGGGAGGGGGGGNLVPNPTPRPSPPPNKTYIKLQVVQAVYESWWKNCLSARVEGEEGWQFVGCNKDPNSVGRTVELLASIWPACNRVQLKTETYHNLGSVCNMRMQAGLPCEGPYKDSPDFNYSRSPSNASDRAFYRIYDRNTILQPDPLIQANAGWALPDVQLLSEEMKEFRGPEGKNKWLRGFFEDQPRVNLDKVVQSPQDWKRFGVDFNDFVFDVRGENVKFTIDGSGLPCDEL